MNKKLLRCLLISFILALLFILFSCTNDTQETKENQKNIDVTDSNGGDSVTEPETTIEFNYYENIPEGVDFDGYTFTILTWEETPWMAADTLSYAEETVGEILQDTAYKRNLEIKELLNIEIAPIYREHDQIYNQVRRDNAAGDCTYDIVAPFGGITYENNKLIVGNQYYDWKKVPYVDLGADWYNHGANESFTILGKQFSCVSDYFNYGRQSSYMVLFNKELFTDYGLEYPYQIAYDGKWTYDALCTYIKGAYRDVNGDGKRDDGDFYGLSTSPFCFSAAIINWGELPLKVDDSGFVLNIFNQKIADMVDRLTDLTQSPDVLFPEGIYYNNFFEGRSLFTIYASNPNLLRAVEVDFGYLPYPKYDEAQPDYIGLSDGNMMGIPNSRTEEEISRTGAVIEAISAASNKYMINAFVKNYFENKILRDEDSINMFYIARRGIVYSMGRVYDTTDLINASFNYYTEIFNSAVSGSESGSVNLASQYEKNADKLQIALDKVYEKMLNNN